MHSLPVKGETAPGRYYIQLGLYGPDTLVRLPIQAGEAVVDRLLLGQVEVIPPSSVVRDQVATR
jgi:hypothetical protein